MWGVSIHDTMSGAKLLDIDPSDGTWRRGLGGGGQGSHTLQLRDQQSDLTPALARQISEPNATTTAVGWNGFCLYAGTNTRAVYSRDTGALSISHNEGPRGLLANRTTFGVGGGYPAGDLVVTDRSAAGAVRAILYRGAGGSWGSTWNLPIDLPADAAGSISFTWRRWDFHMIDDLLGQVEALGYEIDFRPYFTPTKDLRYLTVVSPRISTLPLEFSITAEQSLVSGLTVTRDGNKQLSGVFTLGKGSEDKMLRGESGFIAGPTIPVRDAVRSRKDVGSTARLADMSTADLTEHRAPTEQWDFNLTAAIDEHGNELLDMQRLIPGAELTLHASGDELIPDGAHAMRLIGIGGDLTRTLKPEVQL